MMARLRSRFARLSLRGRIAVWYAIAIPILLIAIAFAAQTVLVAALRGAIDDTLVERAQSLADAIVEDPRREPSEDYPALVERVTENELPRVPLFLRVTGIDGKVFSEFGQIQPSLVPEVDRRLPIGEGHEGRFDVIETSGGEALRLYARGVRDPETGRTIALIQTAESLSEVVAAQDRLRSYTFGIGVAGSVVTILVGLLILRHGFSPLEDILRRVRGMETEHLGEGIPSAPRPPELQQLADSLNEMWRRLGAAFGARDQFVAAVSHELKTPLTALRGQIDVLQMHPDLDDETRETLERMANEVRRLDRMSRNFLLETQLESQSELAVTTVHLNQIAEEVLHEIGMMNRDVHTALVAPEAVVAQGDYDMLKQALLNLVDNACNFSPPGGRVTVRLGSVLGEALLQVQDGGPGIPEHEMPRITQAFYRGERNGRNRPKGVGLGLWIVQQIVDLHHGLLDFESVQAGGTTVTMYLPVIHSSQASRQGGATEQRERTPGLT